jgi:hypothetical protein
MRQRTCRNLSPFATAHLPPFAALSPSVGTWLVHGRPTARTRTIAGTVTITDMDCPRVACGRGCGHGLDADTPGCGLDTTPDRTRTDRGCGHRRGHLPGQTADSPRPLRGRKNLVLTRSKACPVQNRQVAPVRMPVHCGSGVNRIAHFPDATRQITRTLSISSMLVTRAWNPVCVARPPGHCIA